jgi:hypothetical protein
MVNVIFGLLFMCVSMFFCFSILFALVQLVVEIWVLYGQLYVTAFFLHFHHVHMGIIRIVRFGVVYYYY